MTKHLLAEQMRQAQRELGLAPTHVLELMTDDDIIDAYTTCSCCGEKFNTEEEIEEGIRRSETLDDFLLILREKVEAHTERMKVYMINRVGNPDGDWMDWEENIAVKALPTRESAQAECDTLNAKGRGCFEWTELEVKPFASALAEARASRLNALNACHAALIAGSRELFDAHPEFQSFGWDQGVSSWHCCEFGHFEVDSYTPHINGIEGSDVPSRHISLSESNASSLSCEATLGEKLQAEVTELLESFREEDFSDMFDEDVTVTFHRDGRVTVEDCDKYL